ERRRAVADEVRADLEGAGSAGENGSAGAVAGVPSEESGAARGDLDQVVPAGEVEAREVERLRALDADLDDLIAEARANSAGSTQVALPRSLSATALARLADDPRGLAHEIARPMPRKPSAAARFGTRFHAWVE